MSFSLLKKKSGRCLLFWRAFLAVMTTRCRSIPCFQRWESFSLSSRDWGAKTFLDTEWTESPAIHGCVRMHSSLEWLLPWKNRRTILTHRVMKECSWMDDDELVCSQVVLKGFDYIRRCVGLWSVIFEESYPCRVDGEWKSVMSVWNATRNGLGMCVFIDIVSTFGSIWNATTQFDTICFFKHITFVSDI